MTWFICFLLYEFTEVSTFLKSIGVANVGIKRVKGHLFLLEKLGFLKKIPYSSNEYYVSVSKKFYVELNMQKTPHYMRDRERLMFLLAQSMKEDDKDRYAAIRQTRASA